MDSTTADHDLLIKLDTRMEDVSNRLATLADTINDRTLDHENRLRKLEDETAQLRGEQRAQKKNQAVIATVGTVIAIGIALIPFVRG